MNALGLDEKVIVVTGAAGGIGHEVVRGLAEAGAHVLAIDRDAVGVDNVVARLADPGRHLALSENLADLQTHEALLQTGRDRFGRIDGLVHLAAILRRLKVEEVTEDDWDAQLDLNLKATFFFNQAVIRFIREHGEGGAIVNFTSQSFWSGGLEGAVVYAASKGGVVTMSRGLARVLAPEKIRVNTVSPGIIDTPMLRLGLDDAGVQAQADLIPFGRLGKPIEVAHAAIFLCSNQASYITGATLNVSGGQLMY